MIFILATLFFLDSIVGPGFLALLSLPESVRSLPWILSLFTALFYCLICFRSVLKYCFFFIKPIPLLLVSIIFFINTLIYQHDISILIAIRQYLVLFLVFPFVGLFVHLSRNNLYFPKFINLIPFVNLISFSVSFISSLFTSYPFVYSSPLPFLAFYISARNSNSLFVLIAASTILFSFKKSLVIAFIASSILYFLPKFSRVISHLFITLQIKFKNIFSLLLILFLVIILPSAVLTGRNSYIFDVLSEILESNLSWTDLVENSQNPSSPFFLPLYLLSSGRASEYANLISNMSDFVPFSYIFGLGANPPIFVWDLSLDTYRQNSTIHSSFLAIFYSLGFLGIFVFTKSFLPSVRSYISAIPLYSFLFFGMFTSTTLNLPYAILLSQVLVNSSYSFKNHIQSPLHLKAV